MALKVMPATGGLGWAWCTPAWAVTARPTTSAVVAMVSTAVIQRRICRVRVIAVSFYSMRPRGPGNHRWFEAAAPADGAASPGRKTPARGPGVDRAASPAEVCPGREVGGLPPPEP